MWLCRVCPHVGGKVFWFGSLTWWWYLLNYLLRAHLPLKFFTVNWKSSPVSCRWALGPCMPALAHSATSEAKSLQIEVWDFVLNVPAYDLQRVWFKRWLWYWKTIRALPRCSSLLNHGFLVQRLFCLDRSHAAAGSDQKAATCIQFLATNPDHTEKWRFWRHATLRGLRGSQ